MTCVSQEATWDWYAFPLAAGWSMLMTSLPCALTSEWSRVGRLMSELVRASGRHQSLHPTYACGVRLDSTGLCADGRLGCDGKLEDLGMSRLTHILGMRSNQESLLASPLTQLQ